MEPRTPSLASVDSALPFRLHHIGLLVRSIEVATDLQVARYGYRIESGIIHDPVQTAWVRFLKIPGTDHWLELVAPDGAGSRLASALAKRGEGLHHLGYEVADMAAACASLRHGQIPVAPPVPAVAFEGRRVAWFIDRAGLLTELVEGGAGPFGRCE